MARLVARWVRLYTRSVPAPVARRRIDEIDADVHDQIAHERGSTGERRIAFGIAARMVRGLGADLSWRRRMSSGRTARRPGARVALVTAFVLLMPLVAMQFTDEVDWGVADFVAAGVLLGGTGLLLEQAARKARNVAYLAAAAVIGAAAIVLGEADDAPGLVLFGLLLVLGTVVLAVRSARRRA
jgi:hypothetical protein